MADRITVACLQISSGREVDPNLQAIGEMARRARDAGAGFILTPEVSVMLEPKREPKFAKAEDETAPHAIPFFADLARETGAWILVGSMAVKLVGEDRLANRSYLFAPDGGIAARYDKIHMFDVDLAGGESYRESSQFRPGEATVVVETTFAQVGLSVCYDLRFPALYRTLAQAGAQILTVPSAFAVATGRAHWHTLLRARAIETGCFVLAPAQTGTHAEGRKTYGHSLIVDPWGEVLADAGEAVGFITAELDMARVAEARQMVPSLKHDRPFAPPRLV